MECNQDRNTGLGKVCGQHLGLSIVGTADVDFICGNTYFSK